MLLAAGFVFTASAPAVAEESPAPTTIRGANTFYAYVGPGENLDVSFRFAESASPAGAGSTTITLRGPGGIVETCTRPAVEIVNGACSFLNRTSASPGVWRIDFSPDGTSSTQLNRYEWDISVQSGTTDIPGRVYSERYGMTQRGAEQTTDFSLWYVGEQGYQYQADYVGYNGVDSIFSSDATGVAELNTCVSAYESMDRGGPDGDTDRLWMPPVGSCGDRYKIFFDSPSASLPATATLWDGSTVWLQPEVVLPEISALTFTRDSATTSAGTFSFDTVNFVGQLEVLVDANNDGDYSDPEDRRIPAAVTQDGTTTVAFDGLDGLGNPIPSGMPLGARAAITQTGEIHFTNQDVETRTSLSVLALNGPDAGSTTLYWDDSDLVVGLRDCTTPQVDGTAGVDSSGGVHGWICPNLSQANANDGINGSWGDFRNIDDWAYQSVDEAVEIEISPLPLQAFMCFPSAPGLLFQHVSSPANVPPTTLRSVDMLTGAFQDTFTVPDRTINAVGYNVLDNYVYGWDLTAGEIVRVGADGSVQGLGVPSGQVGGPSANVGDVDENGHFWYAAPRSGQWHQVDLNPGSPTYMTVLAQGVIAGTWPAGNDWAYVPGTNALYSVGNVNGVSTLFSFDRGTKAFTNEGPLGVGGSIASGAMYADTDGFLYTSNNLDGVIYRIDVANVTATEFADGPASSGNDGARCASAPIPIDFGDAPTGFGTVLADDGPRHAVPGHDAATNTAPVMLGASIDIETDGQPSAAADGDGADEDGVVFNPDAGYSTPTIFTGVDAASQQPVMNTLSIEASAAGFVSIWVDWNQDGDFLDAGEQLVNAVAVAAGANELAFSQPANPPGIETYVRVRYSTDAPSLASPIGAAPDGEVEDYRVLVERLIQPDACTVNAVDHFAFTFADPVDEVDNGGAPGSRARYENVTVIDGVPIDMVIEVVAGALQPNLAPPNGFGVGGAATTSDDALWRIAYDATLRYSFYVAGTTTPVDINGVFTINDMDGVAPDQFEIATFAAADLASYAVTQGSAVTITESAGNIEFHGNGNWSGEPESRFQVVLEGISTLEARWEGAGAVAGSGFLLDGDGDIGIQPPACDDFGDAPDSYGTTLGSNGASHTIIPGLMIGSSIDFDPDGQPSTLADGDDGNRTADEDGVADPIVVTVGDQTTVVITATNTTAEDAFLAGWIDLNGSGSFDPGEVNNASVVVPANSGTASYTLVFPAGTVTADTFARFRLAPPQGDIIMVDPVGHLHGGEVEDYPVTVIERALQIEKTSDASVNSRPGDVVTYTVTATNTGSADYTDAFPAVVVDDLSGVLDDATYNGDAASSVGGAPGYAAPLISWSGALAAGASVSVTYTVTLVAGGDGVVRNVAFASPCDPADAECVVPPVECDPPTAEGLDPVTGVPCAEVEFLLPRLAHTKVADTTELPADGGVVTYTVTVTNEGPGVFTDAEPGVFSDDLANVLDDATFNSASASSGDVVFDGDTESLSWSGALGVGESATVTYSVTYDSASGDHVLLNVACVPVQLAADPTDPCRSVEIPGAELQDRKTSNPVSGSSVVSGQQVTYTLHFENTGETTATVDTFDEMVEVLDDATLTAGPTTSDPALTATVNGTRIEITGTVPVDATYTVSYTVTVNAFEGQGDHVLGNVLGECLPFDPTCQTEHLVRHVTVTKTSDAASDVNTGDTVRYTVTVTSDGEGDYTTEAPAVARDDLTGVLDDAIYEDDVAAATGTVSYTEPLITWSGPLAAGDSATFTYTVTVTNAGDHVLENVAGPVCSAPEICGPPVTVLTPLPKVIPSKSSDPASGADVNAGDVVTYTLSWVNEGEATGRVDSTDDLSDVLDDADVTTEPVSSNAVVTAARTGDSIRVTGPIEPGQTITVTYQVTIKADGDRGDNIAGNVLTPDVPPCLDEAECPPPITEHFIGELDDWKTVDPVAGSTVQPGQEVTYTLHFENTGVATVPVDRDDVLTRVLDDATVTELPTSSDPGLTASEIVDGRFTVSGSLTPGQVVTVSYTVTVNPDGQRGDDRLGNFLVDRGVEPPVECVPVDGERADCTFNHVSNVVPSKSADPASGAEVSEGQRVTYTLTFENVSTNPDAEAAPIGYTDHLVDVLDDAALTAGPTSSDAAVTVIRDGDTIRISGQVASGDTTTVTYTVTVKAYDRQGNHHLGNVIAKTGEPPVCAEGSNLCTSHDLVPPPPGLASTGVTIAWSVVLTALILLLTGGGAVLISRRRRQETTR